jgi:hypothetical protein
MSQLRLECAALRLILFDPLLLDPYFVLPTLVPIDVPLIELAV